jgi:RNA recognition motif-containing protein
MSRKLYIGNLSYQTEAPELQQLFEQAGTVESVKVMKDMATGRSRGFAFVEMSTDEEAAKAISELNAFQFEGRNLTVNEARPRPSTAAASRTPVRAACATNRAGNELERKRSQPNVGWLFFFVRGWEP